MSAPFSFSSSASSFAHSFRSRRTTTPLGAIAPVIYSYRKDPSVTTCRRSIDRIRRFPRDGGKSALAARKRRGTSSAREGRAIGTRDYMRSRETRCDRESCRCGRRRFQRPRPSCNVEFCSPRTRRERLCHYPWNSVAGISFLFGIAWTWILSVSAETVPALRADNIIGYYSVE